MRINAAILIAIMSIVTIGLRFLPFAIFSEGRSIPGVINYLGKVLPSAIMAMLVVFCLKDTTFASVAAFAPQFIAGAVTAASYAWKKNTLLSILIGTVCYMLLVQMVFI